MPCFVVYNTYLKHDLPEGHGSDKESIILGNITPAFIGNCAEDLFGFGVLLRAMVSSHIEIVEIVLGQLQFPKPFCSALLGELAKLDGNNIHIKKLHLKITNGSQRSAVTALLSNMHFRNSICALAIDGIPHSVPDNGLQEFATSIASSFNNNSVCLSIAGDAMSRLGPNVVGIFAGRGFTVESIYLYK